MKTKVVKKYREDGSLWCEYEVLVDKPDIRHGFFKRYLSDGKRISYEMKLRNDEYHGERKIYNLNETYSFSEWYFEGEEIGCDEEGQEKFKQLTFLENCKKIDI